MRGRHAARSRYRSGHSVTRRDDSRRRAISIFAARLGVSKDVPVGFKQIRLHFDLDTDASEEQLATLLRLTERYCVVYQTLNHPTKIDVSQHATSR